jgi:hypothetical protein
MSFETNGNDMSDELSLTKSKRSVYNKSKARLEAFLDAHTKYCNYQGSAAQKQIYMSNLHKQVTEVMQDPGKFIYEAQKATRQSKNIKKCMDILRDFHFYFSQETTHSNMGSTPYFNIYSHKVGIRNIHKIQTFDKIAFSRKADEIRYFCMCSTLKNWFLAVFHARVL